MLNRGLVVLIVLDGWGFREETHAIMPLPMLTPLNGIIGGKRVLIVY